MQKLRVAQQRLKALLFSHAEVMQLFFFLKGGGGGFLRFLLPLTISLFGAMTQPKRRDAYITEP